MGLMQLNTASVQDRYDFVSKVYTLLGVSLLFCCGGALYGMSMPTSLYLPMIIVELILLFVCRACRRNYPLNLLLLFLFTTVSGLTLGPIINVYVMHGMGAVIPQAVAVTAITFGGLSLYVHITKQNFSFLGGFLFIGLIAMILIGLVSLFFPLPINNLLYSGFGVLLFSGFILFDTSNILRNYDSGEYVAATMSLYLDLINLFLFILRIMSGGRRQ